MNRTQGRRPVLLKVSIVDRSRSVRTMQLTLNLFEALTVQLCHRLVLLAQECDAPVERVGNAQIIAIELVLAIGPLVTQGRLHLLNTRDEALSFLCHLIFLSAYHVN